MSPTSTEIFSAWGWPGVVIATLVLLVLTAFLAEWLVRFSRRALERAFEGRVAGSIFANIIRVVVWLAGVGIVLYVCFDFNLALIWGALGVGGIALSLGAQTTISNLLGGLQTSLSRDVTVGDWIEVAGITGEIRDITWRKVVVTDDVGNTYHIPSSTVTSSVVTVLPAYNTVAVPLVLRPDADIDAIAAELPIVALRLLEEAGFAYPDKAPTLALDGTELAGVSCRLLLFATREPSNAEVKRAVAEPVLEWLRERGALVGESR